MILKVLDPRVNTLGKRRPNQSALPSAADTSVTLLEGHAAYRGGNGMTIMCEVWAHLALSWNFYDSELIHCLCKRGLIWTLVIVNIDYQFVQIYTHLGDKPLSMSVRD